jgi:hypothetical protein
VSVVVDASVIVALVVADERQGAAQARLEGWVEAGEQLHAPAVLPYEVANVLARLVFVLPGSLGCCGVSLDPVDFAGLAVVLPGCGARGW